jgi:hypothetical protein
MHSTPRLPKPPAESKAAKPSEQELLRRKLLEMIVRNEAQRKAEQP